MNYKIGTSGYSYKDWEGVFYPEGLPSGKKLDFYAQHFKAVEINSTYYSIPNRTVFFHLNRKTPADFEFIVKTHQQTTHAREGSADAMQVLIEAIQPIVESGKFSGFLAQFPYSFKNTPTNRDYLLKTKELCEEYPLFVEFRNWTWNRPEVFQFLKENQIGYVNVDQPPLRGLLPRQAIATTEVAYVRFHGRNSENWWEGTNETRYDYLYSEQELREWINPLTELIKRTVKTFIFFNNHPKGKAVQNAKLLDELLKRQIEFLTQ
ncbi:MAG: DUF72 domain-containing protein [Methanobacteriota archaeon]|nr:MAG: DUF72 domain-containing protein [Euryarchaeota archaeon]